MLKGTTEVIEWLRMNKTPYWRIKRSKESQDITRSSQDDDLNLETGIQQIEAAFVILEPGTYYIQANTDLKRRNDWLNTAFRHGSGAEVSGSGAGSLTAIYGPDYIQRQIAEGIEKWTREQRIKELESELDEYRAGDAQFQRNLAPYIGPMMQRIFGVEPDLGQVAGIPESENIANITQEQRLANALEEWNKLDPAFVSVIERLVKYIRENPEKYNNIKMMF